MPLCVWLFIVCVCVSVCVFAWLQIKNSAPPASHQRRHVSTARANRFPMAARCACAQCLEAGFWMRTIRLAKVWKRLSTMSSFSFSLVCDCICRRACLPPCLDVYSTIYSSCVSNCMSTWLSAFRSVSSWRCLGSTACPLVYTVITIWLSVFLPICLSVCLHLIPICLIVCQCVRS